MVRTNNVRKITKFKRSIKAISPVIATLLMIAIAVVASLVVYAWVSGYMGFQTDKAGKAISLPSFTGVADDPDAAIPEGDLIVYVQNVGQGTVEISAVYVDDVLIADNKWAADPSKVISEGNTAEVTITGPFLLNEKHDIKVTTKDGTFMTTTGKPLIGGNSVPTAALTGSFTSPTSATINVGDTITVTLHVVNTGSASETGVTPSTLTLGGTGSATLATGPSPTSATIAAGGSQDFTWTYTAASAGTVTFSGSATGASLTTGTVGPSSAVTIDQPALPDVVVESIGITAPTGSTSGTVASSDIFTVTAQIHLSSGSGSVTATLNAPGYTITTATDTDTVGTSNVAFTWQVTAPSSALATSQISVTAPLSGYNTGTKSFDVTTVAAASLSASFTAPATSTVDIGDSITVTMRVSNTGTASATSVTPSVSPSPAGRATTTTTQTPVTIAGGAYHDFTWTYTAASAGTVTFSGSATGTAQYSGDSVTTGSVGPSNTVTIESAGINRIQTARGTSSSSTSITVTLPGTPTAGNVLIAVIGTYRTNGDSVRTVSSVSGGSGAASTWHEINSEEYSYNGMGPDYAANVEIWMGIVSTGSTTVTITISGSSDTYAVADICEYSGINAASPYYDRRAENNGYDNNPITGTTSATTQASELWIGGITVASNNAQSSPTNGFALLDGNTYGSAMSVAYLEKIVSTTGAASTGTTTSGDHRYVGCIATFKGT